MRETWNNAIFYFMLCKKFMPNKDKTGPQGEGPKTGRGMGKCGDKNNERPARKRDGSGGGVGQRGDGRGLGRNRSS